MIISSLRRKHVFKFGELKDDLICMCNQRVYSRGREVSNRDLHFTLDRLLSFQSEKLDIVILDFEILHSHDFILGIVDLDIFLHLLAPTLNIINLIDHNLVHLGFIGLKPLVFTVFLVSNDLLTYQLKLELLLPSLDLYFVLSIVF